MKGPVGISMELLETTGEEVMSPGSRVGDITEPAGSWQAHRPLPVPPELSLEHPSVNYLTDCPRSRDPLF